MPNRLINETSPYLLQHAHNPVDWYPWGPEALTAARDSDQPILLSVGYSACHWCHVMEHESFENEAIAKLMNDRFVCIKVDREERPDIDHLYMEAVQMMTGQGGWPMTVFLTPEGKPFYGGTYFPPDDRYGRASFPRVLMAVSEAWNDRRDQVEEQSDELVRQISVVPELISHPLDDKLFQAAFRQLQVNYDHKFGGQSGSPKFPQPMLLDFLMRYSLTGGGSAAEEMALHTLDCMASGGIYDHLGGGFSRYSTDERWLVPHFEKMLYDNAQLVQTYLHAWQITKDKFYRTVVVETLDYVLREMTAPEGPFFSTQDADSEGVEGKFFVWSMAEIQSILGTEDAEVFVKAYGVTASGNWEGHNILNRQSTVSGLAGSDGADLADSETRLSEMRSRLRAARNERIKPGTDDKILTAWNGLMISAFAEAGAILDRADYTEAACRSAEFVLNRLSADGLLRRTGKFLNSPEGRVFHLNVIDGFLEDYAYLADGLIHLYAATFDLRWLDEAQRLVDTAMDHFGDPAGAFYVTAADAEQLINRPRDLTDNATPSGNSVMVEVLLKLATFTDKAEYRRRAETILTTTASMMNRMPLAFGRLLCAADRLTVPSRELVIVGPSDRPEYAEMVRAARSEYRPNLVVMAIPSDFDDSRRYPLLTGKSAVDGNPTAYVCESFACSAPVESAGALMEMLKRS